MDEIAERLTAVRQRIALAAERAGRDLAEITLVGVTKTRTLDEVRAAVEAGLQDLGENYAQEVRDKHKALGDRARWHFIGHLQRNKVKYVVPVCTLIHSVDSTQLAVEIGRRAAQLDKRQPILLEVNVSGEESKFGFQPGEALEAAGEISTFPGVELQGLMTMPPLSEDPETSRPYFVRLRELADEIRALNLPGLTMKHLSMGMTQDYEVAVEEGATLVRIGTAIFGPRS